MSRNTAYQRGRERRLKGCRPFVKRCNLRRPSPLLRRGVMCLILMAYKAHPDFPLVIAANRDEFHLRPTAAAAFWPEAPQVLAGRDLQEGGSWLGITLAGRFAAVTNYRDLAAVRPGRRSRGMLVSEFLAGAEPPGAYLAEVSRQPDRYNDFNLLCGLLPDQLWWYSNRGGPPVPLDPGVYGLSNG